MNDLGWKVFNALFPRTLESFSRRFAFLAIYRRLRAQKERLTGNMEDLMPVIARLVRRADPTIPLGDRVQAAIEVLEQAQQEVSRRSREHAAGDVLNGFQGSSHPGMAAALLILVEKDRG